MKEPERLHPANTKHNNMQTWRNMNKYKAIKVNGKKKDEHRHLLELKIGRKLSFNEVVHHKDGDKSNNDLGNLEVMTRSDHSKHHGLGKIICGNHSKIGKIGGNSIRLRLGKKIMICDTYGQELMIVHGYKSAASITNLSIRAVRMILEGQRVSKRVHFKYAD